MALANPVPGYRPNNDFGASRGDHKHEGVDIIAPAGATVVAAAPGTVRNDFDGGLYPKLTSVSITGDDGRSYFYNHLAPGSLVVVAGEHVVAGAQLGSIGNPQSVGYSFPAHCHFSINEGRGATDPYPELTGASSSGAAQPVGVHVPGSGLLPGDGFSVPNPFDAAGDAVAGAKAAASAAADVGKAVAWLIDPRNWQRIGMAALGVAVLTIGVVILARDAIAPLGDALSAAGGSAPAKGAAGASKAAGATTAAATAPVTATAAAS